MTIPIEKVGRTAFVIAYWRMLETESTAPLFFDHIAHLFLDETLIAEAQAMTAASPSTCSLIALRTHYFDTRLLQASEQGIEQVLLLGSGLDSRVLRLFRPHMRFFELDQTNVLDYKLQRLRQAGYDLPSTLVGCNYISDDWLARLTAAHFDPHRPTLIIWEGNSMYIPKPAIERLLQQMVATMPHFTLTFDYQSQKSIERIDVLRQSQSLLAGFAEMQAPWVTGYANIAPLATSAGLTVQDNQLVAALGRRYKPLLRLDPQLLDDYFVCTLAR